METFENGDVPYSCGRAKTEVFKQDEVIPRFRARFSAHTILKRFVWAQIFFKYGGKNYPFLKIPGYVWTIKYDSKTLRVDADIF